MANKLFSEVTGLTGLPSELIRRELALLLEKKGISPDELTMESLRAALADYLAVVAAEMEAEIATTEVVSSEVEKIAAAAGLEFSLSRVKESAQ